VAADFLQLLRDMERSCHLARIAVAGRRRNSRAAAAIDLLAAVPLASATTLASGLGMAVKNATAPLDEFACGDRGGGHTSREAAAVRLGEPGTTALRYCRAAPARTWAGQGTAAVCGRGNGAVTRAACHGTALAD
jgi:hypothetical protein